MTVRLIKRIRYLLAALMSGGLVPVLTAVTNIDIEKEKVLYHFRSVLPINTA